MEIKKLAKQINQNNIIKGFWDQPRSEGEVLWLICTELAELTEADREGNNGSIREFEAALKKQKKFKYSKKQMIEVKRTYFEKHIKNCRGDELADAFIRLCDYCIGFKIKIDEKQIKETVKIVTQKQVKIENLGEELLKTSGLIKKVYDGSIQSREYYITLIFARLIWLSNQLNIPLEKHIQLKMWYNSTRPKMHGKKY